MLNKFNKHNLFNRDAEGRLVEEIRPDETLLQYTYNVAGRLV
ncbi:TPA: hypothetical protein ACKRF0_003568, partial [Proteus mirabilis]